jgi:hypothetical protein
MRIIVLLLFSSSFGRQSSQTNRQDVYEAFRSEKHHQLIVIKQLAGYAGVYVP